MHTFFIMSIGYRRLISGIIETISINQYLLSVSTMAANSAPHNIDKRFASVSRCLCSCSSMWFTGLYGISPWLHMGSRRIVPVTVNRPYILWENCPVPDHNNNCAPNPIFAATSVYPWWRHQMETFSVLLAICVGNSLFTGEFPAQKPVTRGFYVFLDLRLNKRLSKQWWRWWFEVPSGPLWCHCNAAGGDYRNNQENIIFPFRLGDWLD